MQTQDHKTINSPGQGHGNHVCTKCGWSFPNPPPSAKHRKAHKKNCGKIEGYKIGTNSEMSKPNLDEHLSENDDTKSPSLEEVKKVEEMPIPRRRSSGVGSRSDEDVFTDAATEFVDVPPVAGSVVAGETAAVVQGLSDDIMVTQQHEGNSVEDAGDLYPPHNGNGTQLQNIECSRPENEGLEIDVPSEHHLSSSTIDSISDSDSSVIKASVSESMLQCSKIDSVLDSEEKSNLEAPLDFKSKDIAKIPSENAGKTSDAALLPQKVNGDEMEFGVDNDHSSKIISDAGKTNTPGETMKNSSDFAGKTSEAVSEPQMVNIDKLNVLQDNAAMEVNEKQVEGFFDARNISFAKGEFFGQINSIEEASNVEADRSLEMLEGHDSINVPDPLPSKEHSVELLEDYEDRKAEKSPVSAFLDLARELKCVEHGKDDVNETFSSSVLDKPSKHSEALNLEVCSAEDLSVEKNMEAHTNDADMCGSVNVVVIPDQDDAGIGQGEEVFTSPKEQNSEFFIDTNFQSVLDESDNLNRSIDNEEENFPIATDCAVERDAQTRDLQENLSEDAPIITQSDDGRDYEHGSKMAMLESNKASAEKDSEAKVEDLCNSVNLSGTNETSGIDNTPNMIEETLFEENCVASDSVGVSLFNKAMINDGKQYECVTFEAAKKIDEVAGEECLDKVDLGLISDNDDSVDLTENASNKIEAEVQAEALSLIEDSYTKREVGRSASDFAGGNGNLFKQDEAVPVLDIQAQAEALSAAEDSYTKQKGVNASDFTGDGGHILKQEEAVSGLDVQAHAEAVSVVEKGYTKKKEVSASDFAVDDRTPVKHEEAVPDLDVQADSICQTDSLEGNWESFSAVSAIADAPAGTETGSQPSQESIKVGKDSLQPKPNEGKSDTFSPPDAMQLHEWKEDARGQTEGVPEAQTSERANDSPRSKKTEEIMAAASGKQQHSSLKSFLGDAASPNAKDNPILKSQETEKTVFDDHTKEPAAEPAMEEMEKEWNSPSRYPTNIKREKGKGKSKPYWVPFMCCSSVQTS